MSVVLSNIQSSWRDSYASSPEVGLTLRVNGEEAPSIWDGLSGFVKAGFEPPSTKPEVSVSSGGSLEQDQYYCYVYVYASTSRYPFVENAVTGGGSVAPRSNQSPNSDAIQCTPVNKTINVTVNCTTRTDVDKIWVYRTEPAASAEEATANASAGNCYFLISVTNNTSGGTVNVSDDGTYSTTEQIEIDNFVCPQFQYTVYDGTYWWGFGNNDFNGNVTLNGTDLIQLNSGKWFNGRDGQKITFQGITIGGFDGLGTFYFKSSTNNTANIYLDSALTISGYVPFSGTTTCKIEGPATTIYRSKIRNPFAWGFTELLINSFRVPQQWAYKVGGGKGVAIAVAPTDRLLKVDTESPNRSYTLNLNNVFSPETVSSTFQIIEDRHTPSSHFCQFSTITKDGNAVLGSIDVKNFNFLKADAQNQVPITTGELIKTLREIVSEDNAPHFFHGLYDPYTELNCWWVKTLKDSVSTGGAKQYVDTMIWNHAPTGFWGKSYDFDVSASCCIYDKVNRDYLVFLGLETGHLVRGLNPSTYTNIASYPRVGFDVHPNEQAFGYLINATSAASLDGRYIVLNQKTYDTTGIWFNFVGSPSSEPEELYGCTYTIQIDLLESDSSAQVCNKIANALNNLNAPNNVWTTKTYGSNDSENYVLFVLSTYFGNQIQSTNAIDTNTSFKFKRTNRTAQINRLNASINLGSFLNSECNAFWFMFLDNKSKPLAFARCIGLTNEVIFPPGIAYSNCAIDRFYILGEDTVYSGINVNDKLLEGYYSAPGQIYSRLRTYFTLNTPSSVKRNIELWISAKNVDDATYGGTGLGMYSSLFKEFSEEANPPFKLSRDTLPGSATPNSINYLSKTNVPSTKLNQFGIELFEIGSKNWQPMSIVLKTENG